MLAKSQKISESQKKIQENFKVRSTFPIVTTNLTNWSVALNGDVHMETVHGILCEYWAVVVHIKQGNVNSCVITSETFCRSGLLSEYLNKTNITKLTMIP